MKKSRLFLLFAAMLIITMLVVGCGGGAKEPAAQSQGETQTPAQSSSTEIIQLRFGGSGTTTWIYGFCVAMSELVNGKLDNIKLNVQATAGSSSHYGMFKKDEIDLGSGSTYIDSVAYAGEGQFTEKYDTFSAILATSVSCGHVMVAKNSPVEKMKDLEGKKIGIGARGSPTSLMAELILNTLEIKAETVTSTPAEMVEMFKDNKLDAIIYFAGAPNSLFLDIASAKEIRFVPISKEEQEKLSFAFSPSEITSADYTFVTTPTPNIKDLQCILASDKLSADIVYTITKTVQENWNELVSSLPACAKVSAKDAINLKTPLHPGAVKYYEEIGIKVPDNMKK